MISTEQIVLIGFFGVVVLIICFLLMLFYSKPKKPARNEKKEATVENEEKERERILARYKEMKDYLLTYLQCCYGAFIAIFIGMVAVLVIPILGVTLKLTMIVGFWFVGGYYLAQIIYTYGQLAIAFELSDIAVEEMSREVAKLGFPYNLLAKIFKYAGKPIYGRVNAKYSAIILGYLGLLVISIVACLNA
jgi:hypothetical protein